MSLWGSLRSFILDWRQREVEPEVEPDRTPLISAALKGNTREVASLLNSGADVDEREHSGGTALMMAAIFGHTDIVTALLNRRADVNLQTQEGKTALMSAAIGGNIDIVRALLKAGANINQQDEVFGKTALRNAALHGHAGIVTALLEAGANVDQQGSYGDTALMDAAGGGYAEIVKMLLDAGADPGLQDNFSRTALKHATDKKHTEVVAALLDAGENVHDRHDASARPHAADETMATPTRRGEQSHGRAAIFVFDYDRMGSSYGAEAFAAIAECLEGSAGVCAFLDGDLEVAAGGASRVPALLMEIRDNGWNITSHRRDSPLVLLATEARIYAYAAALWTDNAGNIPRLHDNLSHVLSEAYLGYLDQPKGLDLSKFHEIFRPLSLSVRMIFSNGVSQRASQDVRD